MPSVEIYLDESGDEGWIFDKPYRLGGSSRHLTIAAVMVPFSKRHFPKRLISKLYKNRNWKRSKEKKWSQMIESAKVEFANLALELTEKHTDIEYFAMTVKKENVAPHIRSDSNKLYNWMTRLLLVEKMAKYKHVTLIPDQRSIKVKSGNSLHDYLQTALWFELKVSTRLRTNHMNSVNSPNVQFTDMMAGLVQSYHEDGASAPFQILASHIQLKTLFF